jgi:hypothetical protein
MFPRDLAVVVHDLSQYKQVFDSVSMLPCLPLQCIQFEFGL